MYVPTHISVSGILRNYIGQRNSIYLKFSELISDFSRDLEDLSPCRREALISPPSLQGKGAGGLGLTARFST